ncbi:MAG: FkbM family methyltransferase [Microbacteriaceae bacterium]|nr:FkbM family methyltransferase [Microbacteriaceae bacterium]
MPQPSDIEAAYRTLAYDVYGGWTPEDLELLRRWSAEVEGAEPEPGIILDWLGVRTSVDEYRMMALPREGKVIPGLPVPNNQVYAPAIEYIGVITAVERAMARGKAFSMVELGASYGPWVTNSAVLALRAGAERVEVRAVEATRTGPDKILAHAERNGLVGREGVTVRAFFAAVSAKRGHMFFPDLDSADDNGASATDRAVETDYRGKPVRGVKVPAITLDEVLDGLAVADLLHLDLQGGELALLKDRKFLAALDAKVAMMILGAHSREIEATALRTLTEHGWELFRERPARLSWSPGGAANPVGWTVVDGEQIWINPRFPVPAPAAA